MTPVTRLVYIRNGGRYAPAQWQALRNHRESEIDARRSSPGRSCWASAEFDDELMATSTPERGRTLIVTADLGRCLLARLDSRCPAASAEGSISEAVRRYERSNKRRQYLPAHSEKLDE